MTLPFYLKKDVSFDALFKTRKVVIPLGKKSLLVIILLAIITVIISILIFKPIVDKPETSTPHFPESNVTFEVVTKNTVDEWHNNGKSQSTALTQAYNLLGKDRGYQTFNFDDKSYLLIASGTKPNGGYSVEVKAIIENDAFIKVIVMDVAPKYGQPVTAAFDYPKLLISMKQTDKEIRLEWTS